VHNSALFAHRLLFGKFFKMEATLTCQKARAA